MQQYTQALAINLGEPDAARAAKRDLFEDIVYDDYLKRFTPSEQDPQPMTREQLFVLATFGEIATVGAYHFTVLNRAWWGFQAGWTAACIVGAKAQ